MGGGKSFSSNLIILSICPFRGEALVVDPKGERGNWKRDLHDLGNQVNIISLSTKPEDKGRLDPFSIYDDIKELKHLPLILQMCSDGIITTVKVTGLNCFF
jgi:hypothetical protein